MSHQAADHAQVRCPDCGFSLWNPLGHYGPCDVVLYDDARFPGRLIVSLREHHDHFEEMPDDAATLLMDSARTIARLLRKVTSADRVNIAILGNAEPHVHVHVIPRIALLEPEPRKSPWNDPRPHRLLAPSDKARFLTELPSMLTLDGTVLSG